MKNDEKKFFRLKDCNNKWEIIGSKTVTTTTPAIGTWDYEEVEITNGFSVICIPKFYLEDYEIKNREAEAWSEGRRDLLNTIKTLSLNEKNPYGEEEDLC